MGLPRFRPLATTTMRESDPNDLPFTVSGDPWSTAIRDFIAEMDRSVAVAIVEGERDRMGLERAGFTGEIRECATAQGLRPFAASIEGDPIAILTDYDSPGRDLNGKLRDLLPDRRVDAYWRRELGLLLTKRGHYDIEALNNVFRTHQDPASGWEQP